MTADTADTADTATTPTIQRTTVMHRPIGRAATTGLAAVAFVLTVAGGGQLGRLLTTHGTPVQPSYRVGTPISFPSDWQVYRAGERGDVPTHVFPKDWLEYRAGER
jgi:hypothetical protein